MAKAKEKKFYVPKLTHKTKDGLQRLGKFLLYIYKHGLSNEGQGRIEQILQRRVDQLYQLAFGSDCPYRIYLFRGYTDHLFQTMMLLDPSPETICHEMIHVAHPEMKHGKKFNDKVKALLKLANAEGIFA